MFRFTRTVFGKLEKWAWEGPIPKHGLIYSPPTLTGAGHQRTVSTNIGCNQWLSLAKSALKVALAGWNRSLVARTNKHGWAILLGDEL